MNYKNISFERAKEIIDSDENAIILDVREEEEFYTGHAEGAVCFPVDTINEETARDIIYKKDTPVLVYCKTGNRASMAAENLSSLGYTDVNCMGSLFGWPYGLTTLD